MRRSTGYYASVFRHGKESDLLSIAALSTGVQLGGVYYTSGGQGDADRHFGDSV